MGIELSNEHHRHGSPFRDDYIQKQVVFSQAIEERFGIPKKYGFIHAIPLTSRGSEFREFYEALVNGVSSIVRAYPQSKVLQELIPLKPQTVDYISGLEDYISGTLRPDFLIDENGEFQVNEINARFPFNGYMSSYAMNESMGFVWGAGVSELSNIATEFDLRVPGVIVYAMKESEPDWGVGIYREYLRENGRRLLSGDGFEEGGLSNDYNSVIFELTAPEIEERIAFGVLDSYVAAPHINDLRSTLIAHDKRLFAVLSDESAGDFVSSDDLDLIRRHIPYTASMNVSRDFSFLLKNKDDWVIKHAAKGKGKDVYVGEDLSPYNWRTIYGRAIGGDFVAQRKVVQKEVEVFLPHLGMVPVNLEGMLLGFDNKFLSEGAYRARYSDPTRLTNGFMFLPIIRPSM